MALINLELTDKANEVVVKFSKLFIMSKTRTINKLLEGIEEVKEEEVNGN